MGTNEETVKFYDASAAEYAAEAAAMPEWGMGEIDAFVDVLGGMGRILEIGSGGGRDARELERRGLSVRCTDVSQRFVDLLRTDGFMETDWTRSPTISRTRSVPTRRTTASGRVPACFMSLATISSRCSVGSPRRRGPVVESTPLDQVQLLGQQLYVPPGDRRGAAMLAGVARSLLPVLASPGWRPRPPSTSSTSSIVSSPSLSTTTRHGGTDARGGALATTGR